VDTDEEEYQSEQCHSKKRGHVPERERNAGGEERYVRHQWKHAVKDPVFHFRFVARYVSRAPHHDQAVDDTRSPKDSDGGGGLRERRPRSAEERGNQQYGTEVNHRRGAKGIDRARIGSRRQVRDECHHHELQPRERAGRRSHDDVEIFPL